MSRIHIYTGSHYACSLVLLLAQQKPHPYKKCKVLALCVCARERCVGVCVEEGKEWNTFPEAMIKSQREDNDLPSNARLVRAG